MEIVVNKQNFDGEVLESKVPVLVDFWAEWCMPCKMVAPVLQEIARDYEGKLKIGKVNVDEEHDLATRYNVVSIPTLLLFKGGKIIKQQVGAVPRPKLEEWFKDSI